MIAPLANLAVLIDQVRRMTARCGISVFSGLAVTIDQVRRMTARWGQPYLYSWITKNHLLFFLDCAGTEEAPNLSIPTSCWTADPRADSFRDKWWLMSGDTDFR